MLPHLSCCVSLSVAVAILLLCFIACHDCVRPTHLKDVLFPDTSGFSTSCKPYSTSLVANREEGVAGPCPML